jgi:hypothetical protein
MVACLPIIFLVILISVNTWHSRKKKIERKLFKEKYFGDLSIDLGEFSIGHKVTFKTGPVFGIKFHEGVLPNGTWGYTFVSIDGIGDDRYVMIHMGEDVVEILHCLTLLTDHFKSVGMQFAIDSSVVKFVSNAEKQINNLQYMKRRNDMRVM